MRARRALRRMNGRLERAPAWVLAAGLGAASLVVAGWMLTGHKEGGLPLLLLFSAYVVAAYRPPREVLAGAAGVEAALVLVLFGHVHGFGVSQLLATTAAFAVAMLIGWTAQARRQRIEALEHQQEQAGLRAAADERLRIAQELHDIVGHSLGVIAVLAAVGLQVIDTDPDESRRSFANISRTSRSSIAEIRRLLGVVRNPDGSPTYTPVPGLGDLQHLAQQVTGTGLTVDVEVDGELERVPTGVGLTAFRIVQEALTNTIRHAHARRARVRVECTAPTLRIEVVDDGRGPSRECTPGHGLIGMRERVAVYGGSLVVGGGAAGGYRVEALLPFDAVPTP